jgi:hypothetical protein
MLYNSIILAIAAATSVAGHGAIVKAVGDMGGSGSAIGGTYLLNISIVQYSANIS